MSSTAVLAVKSVRQNYNPPREILETLDTFRRMVNHCLTIGLDKNVSSFKMLSLLAYRELKGYNCPSYYKLCAISRSAGILASRKKSITRGFPPKSPYTVKPQLISCYGFKVERGLLRVPLGPRRYHNIPLTKHTLSIISDPTLNVRSFTLTATTVSLTISKEVPEIECVSTAGVDRNLQNLAYGNEERVLQYRLDKAVMIAETARKLVASFKRDDARVRRRIAAKYGQRRRNRTGYLLHSITRHIVTEAARQREVLVLEEIRGIRRLYRKGNWQGRAFRAKMNGWSFGEAQRQIEYKARWTGLPIIRLTRSQTAGTSSTCPRCGERLQSDKHHARQLWCQECGVWMDRDVVAVVNLSRRGRLRFDRSKGGAAEALKGNPTTTAIPGVDAPKLTYLTIG